jgi:hypothetical protein
MKKLTFLFLAGAFIALAGCKTEGCIDPDATNFNADADKDDGSCGFEGSAVFWYGASTSDFLFDDGAVTLTFYVDGNIVGSTAADVFWTAEPNCGQNGSISVTIDLGNAKNKSFTYSVEDQDGWVYWSGVQNFTANTCEAVELTL